MNLDSPKVIEIEINSNCNLKCSYCPNSLMERKEQGEMSPDLFYKIIQDLKLISYSGKITFNFFNEPLLCSNFQNFVKYTKLHLPKSFIELFTNGTRLTSLDNVIQIIDHGIDLIIMTKHESIKKLPIETFHAELPKKYLNRIKFQQHKELDLTNRAGSLKIKNQKDFENAPCFVPSYHAVITVQGKVLPCYEDFNQNIVMGDVNSNSVTQIWNNQKFKQFRADLQAGQRSKHSICKDCNKMTIESFPEIKSEKTTPSQLLNYLNKNTIFTQTIEKNSYAKILNLLNIKENDEILISCYSPYELFESIKNIKAVPIINNINNHLSMSVNEIQSNITEKTKAIFINQAESFNSQISEFKQLSHKLNIPLIEDIQNLSLGSITQNNVIGSFGTYGHFQLTNNTTIITKYNATESERVEMTDSTIEQIKNIAISKSHQDQLFQITQEALKTEDDISREINKSIFINNTNILFNIKNPRDALLMGKKLRQRGIRALSANRNDICFSKIKTIKSKEDLQKLLPSLNIFLETLIVFLPNELEKRKEIMRIIKSLYKEYK